MPSMNFEALYQEGLAVAGSREFVSQIARSDRNAFALGFAVARDRSGGGMTPDGQSAGRAAATMAEIDRKAIFDHWNASGAAAPVAAAPALADSRTRKAIDQLDREAIYSTWNHRTAAPTQGQGPATTALITSPAHGFA